MIVKASFPNYLWKANRTTYLMEIGRAVLFLCVSDVSSISGQCRPRWPIIEETWDGRVSDYVNGYLAGAAWRRIMSTTMRASRDTYEQKGVVFAQWDEVFVSSVRPALMDHSVLHSRV